MSGSECSFYCYYLKLNEQSECVVNVALPMLLSSSFSFWPSPVVVANSRCSFNIHANLFKWMMYAALKFWIVQWKNGGSKISLAFYNTPLQNNTFSGDEITTARNVKVFFSLYTFWNTNNSYWLLSCLSFIRAHFFIRLYRLDFC